MSTTTRDVREIIREEPLMRDRILEALTVGPLTVPEIATVIGYPEHEVMYWVMGMRKYGQVTPLADATDESFFQYQAVARRTV
jgi:hypothetical protein